MTSTRTALFLALLLVSCNTLACYPPPDAKPSNEITQLTLPGKPLGPAVVYTVKKYAIYARPADVLRLLHENKHHSIYAPNDLFDALQSRLPLESDLSTNAWLAVLAPRMPGVDGEEPDSPVNRRDAYFWREAGNRLGYIFAELLEQGKAAVIDLSKSQKLGTLTRDKYNKVCVGGRQFLTPLGEVILQITDWIS